MKKVNGELNSFLPSLERVLDYLRIEHEPGENEGINPPAYWPASGHLRAERLGARYSDGNF